ncbi:MAG: hypothetical protein IT453_04845 [Planctomycetes bacterium]|nr:hypothetical protein [Planctomycetota bacterium]
MQRLQLSCLFAFVFACLCGCTGFRKGESGAVVKNHTGTVPAGIVEQTFSGSQIVFVEPIDIAQDIQRSLERQVVAAGLPKEEVPLMLEAIRAEVPETLYNLAIGVPGLVSLDDREQARARATLVVRCGISRLDLVAAEDRESALVDKVTGQGDSKSALFRTGVTLTLVKDGVRRASSNAESEVRYDKETSQHAALTEAGASQADLASKASVDLSLAPIKRSAQVATQIAWGDLWRGLAPAAKPSNQPASP